MTNDIIINEMIKTQGLVSFMISKESGRLIGEGVLKTHLYIDEIDSISCSRFSLTGIDVVSESFGSNDPFVIYRFTFESYDTFYEDFDYSDEELDELYKESE